MTTKSRVTASLVIALCIGLSILITESFHTQENVTFQVEEGLPPQEPLWPLFTLLGVLCLVPVWYNPVYNLIVGDPAPSKKKEK